MKIHVLEKICVQKALKKRNNENFIIKILKNVEIRATNTQTYIKYID